MDNTKEISKEIDDLLSFLNTWEIPNKERVPKEHLLTLSDVTAYIDQHHTIEINKDSLAEIIQLRTDVREAIETYDVEIINLWVKQRNIPYQVTSQVTRPFFALTYLSNRDSLLDTILVDILSLIMKENFHRIKICPDCKWAFYDQSKSGSKKWCNMNANSPTGRACGTISKVKRFREKNRS
jgi:predicted RNA-binding Zn ribbon-like protein